MDFRVSCCDVFIRLVSRTTLCALSLLCFFAAAIAQEPATSPPPQSAPPPASTQSPAPADKTQSPAPASPAASQAPKTTDAKTEVSMQDTGTTFKLRVNLVQVHVVVRDVKGNPIGNLRREDFQLFDQGKPQAITNFSVETPETRR